MMSLAELRRAVALLDPAVTGARVERIVQSDERRVVVSLHDRGSAHRHLLLCAEPASARLSLLPARPAAPPAPPAFASLLRARLDGARCAGVALLGEDRQALVRFEGREGAHALLLALLGPRTNVFLLDAGERVVGALRPLAETRRDLAPGAPWRPPGSAAPPEGADRFAAVDDTGFFAALEADAYAREARREDEALRARVERALRRAAASLAKKHEALEADLAAGAESERLARQGELLKSVIAHVRPGDREARARDFETGAPVVVALDPARSPRANLDDLFRRARKSARRAERALRERGEAEARAEALESLARGFEALADAGPESLAAFAARPDVARLVSRFAPEAGPPPAGVRPEAPARRVWHLGKRELPPRLQPRVYRTRDGLEIWVGRNDEGNDLLSTRLARGRDLFFHLDASPGSHVVLRTEGRTDPPPESVLDACELAVHFSKQRKATVADVLVTPIQNVRKPRGAKPGLVHVTGGRTVRLRRDPGRLERILGSREGAG
jgi:predicted ribosome quality control (RQC) complex YloA/Tae2 family protein